MDLNFVGFGRRCNMSDKCIYEWSLRKIFTPFLATPHSRQCCPPIEEASFIFSSNFANISGTRFVIFPGDLNPLLIYILSLVAD